MTNVQEIQSVHFIQLPQQLLSSMTQARCESLKPCTRLFCLNNSQRGQGRQLFWQKYGKTKQNTYFVCLLHMWQLFWRKYGKTKQNILFVCRTYVADVSLSQIEKIWYFDFDLKQENQMPEWMLSSQMSKDFETKKSDCERTQIFHLWYFGDEYINPSP